MISNETRPYLQGARLTAWGAMKDEIDVTLVADNAAAALIRRGLVDAVVVGTGPNGSQRRCGQQNRNLCCGTGGG